ncbi:hypothetical protein QZH41_012511 [Actinostola sp. cb2023]|nr:hypothetical protein QZH41_012511 [Actinostola sp. cb2023]
MGISSDSKVLIWKKSIEEILSALRLLEEVKRKQVPELGEDDMAIDVVIDFGEEIVGDNIDYSFNARIQTKERTNQSIHWTQQYAILDRVNDPLLDNTKPQKSLKDVQLIDLLPVKEVQDVFEKNCAILVSRIISKYLKAFKRLQDVVTRHIPHPHAAEMAEKSNICCLGLQFKNPNVAGEMAQLLVTDQEKYVPCTTVDGKPEVLTQIPLHGDQLFEERARNVQWTFLDGINMYDRLEGITTEAADWHAKLNLYSIEFETFVSDGSAREIGTSRASMNRVGKTRAAQGVKKYYNEYKDFHQCEVEAHICASFMEMLNMKNTDGVYKKTAFLINL